MKYTGLLVLMVCLVAMISLVWWGYTRADNYNRQAYQRAFENDYRHDPALQPPPAKPYDGTKESDIRKYRGHRYSTY